MLTPPWPARPAALLVALALQGCGEPSPNDADDGSSDAGQDGDNNTAPNSADNSADNNPSNNTANNHGADAGPDAPSCQRCDEAGCGCEAGQRCEASTGQCEPGCAADAQCPDGQICQAGACVQGCRAPADCPDGQTCRALLCVDEPCSLDSDCAQGETCAQDGVCAFVGPIDCQSNDDCGLRWTCDQGTCSDLSCERSDQCAPEAWCNAGVCERRSTAVLPFALARVQLPTLDAHVSHTRNDNLGFGGGLFDMDGDLDLDLFLGSQDEEGSTPPCVWRNTSTPGALSFEPVASLCDGDPRLRGAVSGWAVDLEQDGLQELVVVGLGVVALLRPGREPELTDLLAAIPQGDPARFGCFAGVVLPYDLDMDGHLDLEVGCQGTALDERQDLYWRFDPAQGAFSYVPWSRTEHPDEDGIDLALGVLDVDRDGLLDVIAADDTFSNRDTLPAVDLPPGGVWRRCSPVEGCEAEGQLWRFGDGTAATGSYMSVGNLWLDGLGDHLYLSDWGPNRLLSFDPSGRATDRATELGLDHGLVDGTLIFAWGVQVDDFDRNGHDDLFLAQGMQTLLGNVATEPIEGYEDRPEFFAKHQDLISFQTEGARFTTLGPELGLRPHSHQDSDNPDRLSSSRGSARADLDADGRMELLIGALEGHLRLYAEQDLGQGERPRCTLVPKNRLVPSVGYGYAVADPAQTRWRRRDLQGQHRFGGSPFVLSELGRGWLEFPSGARVAFDCGDTPGPLVVEEPDWLHLSRDEEGKVVVTLTGLPDTTVVEAALRDGGPSDLVTLAPLGQGRWRVDVPYRFHDMLLRLDGRWLPRWFVP